MCMWVSGICAHVDLNKLECVQMGANAYARLHIWDVLFYFLFLSVSKFIVSHQNKGQRGRFHTWQMALIKLVK